MSDIKKIRVGLAGFGHSGKIFHAPFIKADSRFYLKKIYERTSNKSREEYSDVELVREYEELLKEDIDLVVICTPNLEHYKMAKMAILSGKHVVLEKPMATSSNEAKELFDYAKKYNVILSIYQNRRLDGDFLTIKEIVKNGTLGKIVDYECHYDRYVQGYSRKQWKVQGGYGVNILYDLGIHLVDQVYSLWGMPSEIYADFRKQREETKEFDNFIILLYYADKKVTLSASETVVMPGPHFMIHGTEGSFIKYGMDVQEADLMKGKRPVNADWGHDMEKDYGSLYSMKEGNIKNEIIPTIPGDYRIFYSNMYKAIMGLEKTMVSEEEAINVLKILEYAQESNQKKKRINVENI